MKITWYDHLYTGEKAEKRRYQIIQAVREGKPQIRAYVITPASNGNNILDIYPSAALLSPWNKEKAFHIIGIAADYWEALEVVRQIIDDIYQETGGVRLPESMRPAGTAGHSVT